MSNTIAQNLARLVAAKTAIANAITTRGGTVTPGDGLEEFPNDILGIPNRTVYSFTIDKNESDPYDRVIYLEDAVGMTPASMGSTSFDPGSWGKVWFIPKPCMLKWDGTVDYYLDPNDYSKKLDGTASDYNNLDYHGDAMMEFGLLWYKFVPGDDNYEGTFYLSNYNVDGNYRCDCNRDANGNIIPHFYLPIYNGVIYDGKMRSISGIKLNPWSTTAYSSSSTYAVGDVVNYNDRMWECTTAVETPEEFDNSKWTQFAFNGNTSGQQEVNACLAKNTTNDVEWYTDVLIDRSVINALHILISKSCDSQGVFGRGVDSGSQTAKENYITGEGDDKGLFYGSTANGNTVVKTFGMENWWGLVWHRTAGLIGTATGFKYKTTQPYNSSGTGYSESIGKSASSNWLKYTKFGEFGMLPSEVDSQSTKYYKDYYYNGNGYALVGGSSYGGSAGGSFCFNVSFGFSDRYWSCAASPSCKPCLKNNEEE